MNYSQIIRALLGLALPLSCAGCGAVGGLVSATGQLFQLAMALAAIALPYLAWYYYNKHQD
jgi:hypothetical protein